jgi:proteasome lid subunit RPN8/RPN11
MNKLVTITPLLVEQTILALQASGRRRQEGVVLWLGHRSEKYDNIVEVFEPMHRADVDYFHIPPQGMNQLLQHLGTTGTAIVAQVHSHPGRAFHSRADDEWAIVRHVGALSIVLPQFASSVTLENFKELGAFFRLSAANVWQPVSDGNLSAALEIR